MKHLLKSLLLVTIIGATILPACKKYDEGPTLSLASKTGRVCNTWVIDKLLYDGVETASGLPTDYTIEIKKDGTYIESMSGLSETGTWEFDSKKEAIIKDKGTTDELKSTILKLKSTEMWTENDDVQGGVTHKVETHLKQK